MDGYAVSGSMQPGLSTFSLSTFSAMLHSLVGNGWRAFALLRQGEGNGRSPALNQANGENDGHSDEGGKHPLSRVERSKAVLQGLEGCTTRHLSLTRMLGGLVGDTAKPPSPQETSQPPLGRGRG